MTDTFTTGPYALVTQHIDYAHAYASQAFNVSMDFLDRLADYVPTIDNLVDEVDLSTITTPSPDFQIPASPTVPSISITIPEFPADFVPGDSIDFDENALAPFPTYDLTAPTVDTDGIPLPDDLSATAPGDAPTLDLATTYPDAPTYTLPTVPTFEELNIPEAVEVDLPVFSIDLPTDEDVTPPGNIFSWSEDAYDSTLVDAVAAKLLSDIQNGGTGLSVDVETAIWDRARNREDQNAVRTEQQILSEQAARGLSRPSGSVFAALEYAAQEAQHKIADLSREIAIKQAELEQENVRFAVQQAIALEGTLINLHNSVQQRAFEAARYVQDIALELYRANIQKFQIQLEVYRTYAQAYETRVRGELAKIEVYRTQLEGQRILNDINNSKVQLYIAQLDGIKTSVDVYRAQIEAIKTRLEAEATKISSFRTEVEAYAAQVNAKQSEYQNYATRIQAELAKVNVFDSQVKAYTSRIEAYAKSVDAQKAVVDSNTSIEELRLRQYITKLDSIVKSAQTQQLLYGAAVDAFRGEAALFTAQVGAESARVDAENKIYDLELQQALADANIALKNAEIKITNVRNSTELVLEALKQGAAVSSQLTAASLSGVNVGSNVSGTSTDYHYYEEK